MAKARSLGERIFISKSDLKGDPKDQTPWKVRTPTARQKENVLNAQSVTIGVGNKARTLNRFGSFRLEVLRIGLVSVENFPDEAGVHHDVPALPTDRAPNKLELSLMDEFISRIDDETQDELFTEIWGRATVTDEDHANLDSASG